MSAKGPVLDLGQTFPLALNPTVPVTASTQVLTFFINTVIAVSFFSIALTIYFFVVAAQIERQAVSKNAKRMVAELSKSMLSTLDASSRAAIKQQVDVIQLPDMQSEDAAVEAANHKLVVSTLWLVGGVFLGALILVLVMYFASKHVALTQNLKARPGVHYPNLLHIVKENLVIVGFVLCTEVFFMVLVGLHYRSIDVNAVKSAALQSIVDFLKTQN